MTGRDVLRLMAGRGAARAGLPSSYVNIHFGVETYNRIEFRTSLPAFGSDNHAFTQVTTSEADAMWACGSRSRENR